MAKQTFTTGQVLTAAQMTSLQQTAMLGGNAAVKTTSYVLVAADAGTSVAMNSTSATTITVNTGLFAAGDTVTILNQNTGTCTVTAGTATVRKASGASLALSQYQGGVLDFISTSEAIFFPFDVGGASIPLTTKGDLFGFDTAAARIPIGTNNQVLTADSTQALGLKWASPAAATKSFSLLNGPSGTALTGSATITVSSLSGYDQFQVLIYDASSANANSFIQVRFSGDSGSNYGQTAVQLIANSTYQVGNLTSSSNVGGTEIYLGGLSSSSSSLLSGGVTLFGANTSGAYKTYNFWGSGSTASSNSQYAYIGGGTWKNTAVVSSISIISSSGNFDSGTVYIFGAA